MLRTLFLTLALLGLTSSAQAAAFELERWLDEPDVKLVAVEFYADWCGPCKEAAPQWEALRQRYASQGLMLVVVNVDEESGRSGRCSGLPWRPDESICDAAVGERLGVTKLPEAFVWSWQGNLLVERGQHVDEIEKVISGYLDDNPRVRVAATNLRGKPDRALRRQVEGALQQFGKLTIVPDAEMRKRLAAVRKESHAPSRRDDQQCDLGAEVSPNSLLLAERFDGLISLTLSDAVTGCQRATVSVPWDSERSERSIKKVAHKLMAKLKRREVKMPGTSRPRSQLKERRLGARQEGWTAGDPNATAMVRFRSQPTGALVMVNGKPLKNTPCQKLLPTGSHEVAMLLSEHLERRETVVVETDQTVTWPLEADFATLDVDSTPTGLHVMLDAEEIGKTPLRGLRVSTGAHRVQIRSECHEEVGDEIVVDRGENRRLTYEPKPRPAGLQVDVTDGNGDDVRAEVFVDGTRVGKSPGPFTVGMCSKTLEVRDKTWGQASAALSLREREISRLEIRLGTNSPDLIWALLRDFRQGYSAPVTEIARRYERACRGGDILACSYETWHRANGANRAAASPPMVDACATGHAVACLAAGWVLTQGEKGDTPKATGHAWRTAGADPQEGARLLTRGCDLGLNRACTELGRLYHSGVGVKEDNSRAMRLYKQACDGGNMDGCSRLGVMSRNGQGVARDDARAVHLFKQACDGGNMDGCNNLGVIYENGHGVTKDDGRAVKLYKQACDGGNMHGCSNLGQMYHYGRGVTQDEARAMELYKQACDGGSMFSCCNLGNLYQEIDGVWPNSHRSWREDLRNMRAVKLFKKACDGGYMRGCYRLGGNYQYGHGGTPKNPSYAAELYKKACDGGYEDACVKAAR